MEKKKVEETLEASAATMVEERPGGGAVWQA